MTAWLHAHALAAVVIALFAGFNGGVIMTCLFVSGRDSTVRRETRTAEDVREMERAIQELMGAGSRA